MDVIIVGLCGFEYFVHSARKVFISIISDKFLHRLVLMFVFLNTLFNSERQN